MANTAANFGFKHLGYLGGGAPDYQYSTYAISSSNATAIGFGDPVGYTNTTSPYITQYTAALATTIPMVGIFYGCTYQPTGGGAPVFSPFWPGSQGSNATAYVIDAPNARFLVATLNTAVTSANIGNLITFNNGSCSTTGSGFSTATIDQATATSTGTTTSILPFRILQLYQGVGNGADPTTPFNWAIVGFNFQLNRSFAGG